MDRTQQLRGAFILGLMWAALAGCSEDSAYKSYTPEAPTAAPAVATAEAPVAVTAEVAPPVEATAIDSAEPVAAPAADAEPAVADGTAAADSEPQTAVEVAAARPEEIAAASDPAAAGESESDETLIAAVGTPAAVAAVTAEPLVPKLLVTDKSFKKEGDALRVSYDDIDLLKVLNMEPVVASAPDMFPQWLKDLEGQRIRIRGYMKPGELAEDLPFFVLARDTKDCCFGANSKSYDIIPVIMREGVTTDYIHFRPFDVVGEFHIGVELDFANPEKVEFMYRIEDAVVIYKE